MSADEPAGLTRCPPSRSRRRRSPWGIDSWRSLRSASIAIRVAVSGRLVLPGTLPRTALTRERNQVRTTSAPYQQRLYISFCSKALGRPRVRWFAAVAPSKADHVLPLIAQPLGLGCFRIALIIFGSSPAKRKCARQRVGGDAEFGCAGAGGDPAALSSSMAVANGEHRSRVTPPRIVGTECLENILLGKVQTPLLDLNRSIRKLWVGPQQTAKVGAGDAQLAGGVRHVHTMPAQNLDDRGRVKTRNAVPDNRLTDKVAHAHDLPRSSSNCSTAARRSTMRLRLRRSSRLVRLSSIRPGRG